MKKKGLELQVEQAAFFSIVQAKPQVTLGILKNQITKSSYPMKKEDRFFRTIEECSDGENCIEEKLNELNIKINFFVKSILEGKNFLIDEDIINNILFCSFDNILQEKIEFNF